MVLKYSFFHSYWWWDLTCSEMEVFVTFLCTALWRKPLDQWDSSVGGATLHNAAEIETERSTNYPAAYHSFSNAVEEMCLLWASSPALGETLIALQMPGQEEQERAPNCPADSYQAIATGWPLV